MAAKPGPDQVGALVDDEPLSDAEIASIERSKRQIARGEYVADEDLDEFLSRTDD